MEGDQDKIFDWSGPAAEGLFQDPGGPFNHLLQVVVHRAGNIEHKGQRRGAVTGLIYLLKPGEYQGVCQESVHADKERQDKALQ